MKIKKSWLGLFFFTLFSISSAFASTREVTIGVKGMVCSFCAQGITKKFNAQTAVEAVQVSLERKQVKLTLRDGQNISDETIKDILTKAGFNVERVERTQ